MLTIEIVLSAIVAGIAGVISTYFILSKKQKENQNLLLQKSESEAKKIILDAQEKALEITRKSENQVKNLEREVNQKEKALEIEKEKVALKYEGVEKQQQEIEKLKKEWELKNEKSGEIINKQIEKLENIAKLTKEEAKKIILDAVEKKLESEIGRKIAESEEKIKTEVDTKARELLADAMQHGSNDYIAEYTVSVVQLDSEDIKGRIIGKEGRNIRAFEDNTGVNLDLDESPNSVSISSFDPVRREIARISLLRLIKDGRIHPARIEEIVAKTKAEMEKIIYKEGEALCHKVGVYNLNPDIVKNLGKYKYRYSYGQNMIQHTLEEVKIGVNLAHEIGADVTITKLACLLHDIGKVFMDAEGSHIEVGADYLRKMRIDEKVVRAVEQHHEDHPDSVEGILLQIADNISGGRPGARYEDYENYAKRMTKLEETALSYNGVEKAFAISAGRELRVIVNSDKTDDASAIKLANDIAEKIQKEQNYPGTVKVTVIRETRAVGIAK